MKNLHLFVLAVLLVSAGPLVAPNRAWTQTEAAIAQNPGQPALQVTLPKSGEERHQKHVTVGHQSSVASSNSNGNELRPAAETRAELPLPQPPARDLPDGNSSLPLLSVIGFGILVGGVISALRTRSVNK